MIRPIGGCVGRNLRERDQRDADVAELVEQAVQRGLVHHGAADDGGAVVLGGKVQSVEPRRPAGAEMPGDADLVLRDAGEAGSRALARRSGGAVVRGHAWTVRTDLVSAHHIIW